MFKAGLVEVKKPTTALKKDVEGAARVGVERKEE